MTPTSDHPYSPAFVAGDTAYVSGSLSVDEAGQAVSGVEDALTAAIAQVERRLATVGLGLEHVTKLTYFVTDVTTRDTANELFATTFTEPRPARSYVEVSRLPYGCTVEIDATASLQPVRSAGPCAT